MDSATSNRAIADRLRGILAGQDGGNVDATASRLGISVAALRMSIDELTPSPDADVLAAVTRTYAVDPTWLLTGEYDLSTHRRVLADGDESAASDVIRDELRRLKTPPVPMPSIKLDRAG